MAEILQTFREEVSEVFEELEKTDGPMEIINRIFRLVHALEDLLNLLSCQ